MENFFIPSSRRGSCSRRVSLTEIAKEEFRSHIRWCTYSIVDYFVSYKRGIDFAMNPPQKVSAYEDLFNTLATPKSAARETSSELHLHHLYFANSPSLIFRLLSSNTFSGFMSLWMIFFKWQLYTALQIPNSICSITCRVQSLCIYSKTICINVCRVLRVNCAGRNGTIYNLIEELVSAVAFDPLLQAASLTVLHYNEHETLVREDYCVIDFHHMFILQPSMDLDLGNN